MTPHGAGYKGEVRVNAPHPRSYGWMPLQPTIGPGLFPSLPNIPESVLEAGTRRYCVLWGIKLPRGKARCKPIGKPKGGNVPPHVRDSYLEGQTNLLTQGAEA